MQCLTYVVFITLPTTVQREETVTAVCTPCYSQLVTHQRQIKPLVNFDLLGRDLSKSFHADRKASVSHGIFQVNILVS